METLIAKVSPSTAQSKLLLSPPTLRDNADPKALGADLKTASIEVTAGEYKLLYKASRKASKLIVEIRANLLDNTKAHQAFMREIEKLRVSP